MEIYSYKFNIGGNGNIAITSAHKYENVFQNKDSGLIKYGCNFIEYEDVGKIQISFDNANTILFQLVSFKEVDIEDIPRMIKDKQDIILGDFKDRLRKETEIRVSNLKNAIKLFTNT